MLAGALYVGSIPASIIAKGQNTCNDIGNMQYDVDLDRQMLVNTSGRPNSTTRTKLKSSPELDKADHHVSAAGEFATFTQAKERSAK